jgi:hypothetical protein
MLLKYIIIEKENIPVLFPLNILHSQIAINDRELKSAGFCVITLKDNSLDLKCFGESTSLNIKSNPEEDYEILKRLFSCKKNKIK